LTLGIHFSPADFKTEPTEYTMANPDLETLLNALEPFAKQMLSKHGEFYPFGATMTPDGQITANAGYDGNEQPEVQELIDLLTRAFRQQAASGQIRAAGLCKDIRTIAPGQTEKTDALCFKLEHQTGEAITVCIPYKKGLFGGYKYGQLFAGRHEPEFFVPSAGAA
jgi:hypothetical protein